MLAPGPYEGLILWTLLALVTAVSLWLLLRPILSAPARDAGAEDAEADIAVYRDQLGEVEDEVARGLIGEAEAEAARTEISRKLLAASRRATAEASTRSVALRRFAAIGLIVAVPALCLGLYLRAGSPGVPDQPQAARLDRPVNELSVDALVIQVEKRLREEPEDIQGWSVVAPIYVRLGRFDDAVRAWRQTLVLGGPTPARLTGFGEALMMRNDGTVDEQAEAAFEEALKLDPENAQAAYYLGLGALQRGDRAAAKARWTALLENAPPGAPWAAGLKAQLAELDAPDEPAIAPQVDREAMEAVAALDAEDQQAMIEGMVGRLARRLEDNPGDLDGWLRLARAYQVLGRPTAARSAIATARTHFEGDAAAEARLDALAAELPAG